MKFKLINTILTISLCSFAVSIAAQEKKKSLSYTSAKNLSIIGKVIETIDVYDRIDTAKYKGLPASVARLLTNSAGLAIRFTTNSDVISAKWCVSKSKPMVNMVPIAHKGLDLYIKNGNTWQFAGIGKVTGECNEEVLITNMDASEKECLLYLPLYDQVDEVEIGVEKNATLVAGGNPFAGKVLIYGSSIAQGASASRPGLAYPAKLSRQTGINFINLGVSGSAKMEPEVADMLASFTADAFMLDCVPNSSPEQITERTAYLINTIRNKHPKAPIIVLQSLVRETGYWDKVVGEQVKQQNINIQTEVSALLGKGVKDLYFITSERMIGDDHEGTIDGTHPNDLGFDRMVNYIRPLLVDILSKYNITRK